MLKLCWLLSTICIIINKANKNISFFLLSHQFIVMYEYFVLIMTRSYFTGSEWIQSSVALPCACTKFKLLYPRAKTEPTVQTSKCLCFCSVFWISDQICRRPENQAMFPILSFICLQLYHKLIDRNETARNNEFQMHNYDINLKFGHAFLSNSLLRM